MSKAIVGGAAVLVLGVGGGVWWWFQPSLVPEPTQTAQVVTSPPPRPVITAKIKVQLPEGKTCTLGSFNNDTGHMTDVDDSCAVEPMWNGSVKPMGTIQRLENIQKSFEKK